MNNNLIKIAAIIFIGLTVLTLIVCGSVIVLREFETRKVVTVTNHKFKSVMFEQPEETTTTVTEYK